MIARGLAGTRLNRMQGLIELGRWDEAEAIFNEYLEADAAELGSLVWPGAQAVNAAWLYLLRGDIAAGRRLVEEGAPLVAHAQIEMRVQHEAARAAVANAEGDHVGALTMAEATLRACVDETFPVGMRAALIEAVEAAFALGQAAKVVELMQLVREHFRPGRQPSVDAHILRWEARLTAALGDYDRAVPKFHRRNRRLHAVAAPVLVGGDAVRVRRVSHCAGSRCRSARISWRRHE